jgi:hypothetical protein
MTTRLRLPLLVAALALAAAVPQTATAATRSVDVRASVKMLPGGGASLLQSGTFSGAPFGRGKVTVRTFVGRGRGSVVRFRFVTSRGTVTGTGDCAVDFRGSQILYRGTATITGGSGAYRHARGRGLRVSGRGELSGERFKVRLTGRVAL